MVKSPPKFVVAQTGARRGYAVPAILARAGMLERFYTDVCGNVGWGHWLARGAVLPPLRSKLQRLINRRVPAEIASQTVTFAGPSLRWAWQSLFAGSPTERFRLDTLRVLELGDAAARAGFGEATHLYSMLNEFPSLLTEAHRQGVKVISEVYILISTERLMEEERRRFPEWEPVPPNWNAVRAELMPEDTLLTCTDHFICPSEAVRADLVSQWAVEPQKTSVVPYGMSPHWLELQPQPERGRILFVGTAELRKGIHYLAMASHELKKRGREYEFRIAGHVDERVRTHAQCQHLRFLGRVPRHLVHEEFQKADVFVLPSLAEGSAEVTYEALASGLPVVTTAAAGSVARDGVEGRIIPERDVIALADAIESLVEDRALRNRMSEAARTRAADYTWERYGERLLSALKSLA